jgi:hypothetical protein
MAIQGRFEEAAKKLGRRLSARSGHVVGVSLKPVGFPAEDKPILRVDVDSAEAISIIPPSFQGCKVEIRVVGTPHFLNIPAT